MFRGSARRTGHAGVRPMRQGRAAPDGALRQGRHPQREVSSRPDGRPCSVCHNGGCRAERRIPFRRARLPIRRATHRSSAGRHRSARWRACALLAEAATLLGYRFEPRRDGPGGKALPPLRGATKLAHTLRYAPAVFGLDAGRAASRWLPTRARRDHGAHHPARGGTPFAFPVVKILQTLSRRNTGRTWAPHSGGPMTAPFGAGPCCMPYPSAFRTAFASSDLAVPPVHGPALRSACRASRAAD